MILFCDLQPKDWLNVILAIIGILVSGGGLIVAINQIMKMRTTAEAVQEEVKASQKRIRQTLDSTGGKAITTSTIITKNRIFVPIIPEMEEYFDIKEGSRKFVVRFDDISS